MSIELSPSQERRLHSILDRGLDTLHDSVTNISRSTPNKSNLNLSSNRETSSKSSETGEHDTKSKGINKELKSLQAKLATLEAKLSKNSENKPPVSRAKSPFGFLKKRTADCSPKANTSVSRRKASRERLKHIENSVKELSKLERSISPCLVRHRSSDRERVNVGREKGRVSEGRRKEGKVEGNEVKELTEANLKLKEDYEKLLAAFKRSEKIRKKQGEVIVKLKSELRNFK